MIFHKLFLKFAWSKTGLWSHNNERVNVDHLIGINYVRAISSNNTGESRGLDFTIYKLSIRIGIIYVY